MLDYLFLVGDVAIAGRNSQFEVLYDLPERVLPAAVLEPPDPEPDEASVELVRRGRASARGRDACVPGATTTGCRSRRSAGRAVDDAGRGRRAAAGDGAGWTRPAYLHRDARLPRRVDARALLSPFDPVVWERDRAEALFDFRYRIEIYVPAHKRVHGYYVLPFLLGDRLVARVDLKADRAAGALLVQARLRRARGARRRPPRSSWPSCAGWPAGSGSTACVVGPRGDLAPAVAGLTLGSCVARYDGSGRRGAIRAGAETDQQGVRVVPAIIDKLLRIGEGKILRQLEAIAKAVNAIEDDFVAMTDDELRGMTGGVQRAARGRARPSTTSCPRRSRPSVRRPSGCSGSGTSTSRSWVPRRCTSATSPR